MLARHRVQFNHHGWTSGCGFYNCGDSCCSSFIYWKDAEKSVVHQAQTGMSTWSDRGVCHYAVIYRNRAALDLPGSPRISQDLLLQFWGSLWVSLLKCTATMNICFRFRNPELHILALLVESWSPASSSQRVWHGLATAVDSMQESIHAIRCDFLSPQGTQSERIRSR